MKDLEYDGECFSGIKLVGESIIDCEFVDCEFVDCVFEECLLVKTFLSDCRFTRCTILNLKGEYSTMKYLDFSSCSISGVNWFEFLPGGRLAEPFSRFDKNLLKYNTFANMKLNHFSFLGNEIVRSIFADCVLCDASFNGCDMPDTEFFKCDLRNADFRSASGYKINILENKLKSAKFSYPDVLALLDVLGIKVE